MGDPPTHDALAPTSTAEGVWLDPVPHLIVGPLKKWASMSHVDAVRIPAYWYIRPGENRVSDLPVKPGHKVVLAFHGGAYVVRSAHPADPTAALAKGILAHSPPSVRVLSVEYRVSSNIPGRVPNPFPAALMDALAAYSYLVHQVRVHPNDIILEGNSAGGNLALALTRHLIENRHELYVVTSQNSLPHLLAPSGLVLASPWVDLSHSHRQASQSYLRRRDWIGPLFSLGLNPLYVGPHNASTNPYISPVSGKLDPIPSFAGWPRTLLIWARDEDLADSIQVLKERMCADMGEGDGIGQVMCRVEPDATHNFAATSWHDPEYTNTLKAIVAWIPPP